MTAGSELPVRRVLIVGGGLAGLTAAVALGQIGIEVDVFELKPDAEGAGLGLKNGAIDALAAVGALGAVLDAGAGYDTTPLRLFDAAGNLISSPVVDTRSDGLPSYVKVDRPLLISILRGRVEETGGIVRLGVTVDSITQRPECVDVSFSDGSSGRYDLVVGADGLRSQVRAQVFGTKVQPIPTGAVSLRWIPKGVPQQRDKAGFYYGQDAEIVVLPMHGDMTYINVQHAEDRLIGEAEARSILHTKFAQFTAPYLVEIHRHLTDDQSMLVRRYEWLFVADGWHNGRVLLIGDAAHATTAHLGSGGVMALEDAVVLGEELTAGGALPEALGRFQDRRFDRCRNVVDTSVRLSEMQRGGATAEALHEVRWPAMQELAQPY